jgi:hypothetical protein
MKQHLARVLASAAIVGLMALSGTVAWAQEKTATQCRDEWRANKADNQAKGITEKAYVAQCRGGGAAAQTAPAPAPAAQRAPAAAQEKTATQCRDEWRANKGDNQAKGITEKAYVAQCRGGGAAAQPAPAPSAQPTPAAAPKTTAAPAPRPATTTAVAPTGANQFANETEAKLRCPSDTVVWVNERSKIYHFSGHKDYGHTKVGAYMCEKDATAAGDRAAKDEKRP